MQGPRFPSHFKRTIEGLSMPPPLDQPKSNEEPEIKPESHFESLQRLDGEDVRSVKETEQVRGGGTKASWKKRRRIWIERLKRHSKFIGPGIMASVAYFDPGNYATGLQAGASYGYSLLFIVLFSGLCAILLQILATRLGCVTGRDLAVHCRLKMWNRPKHRLLWNAALITIYIICEGAIILTDLAELLGSAIAINLLIPKIPLWGGILLTSSDVLLILLMFNSYPSRFVTRSMRIFEGIIATLVFTVLISFVVLLVKISPDGGQVLKGYLPSNKVVDNGALYISVGIVGATVMPHALFLGSRLATMERIDRSGYLADDKKDDKDIEMVSAPSLSLSQHSRPTMNISLHMPHPPHLDRGGKPKPKKILDPKDDPLSDQFEPPSLEVINAHLGHSTVDIALSLLGFAILINSSILIIGGAAFYYHDGVDTEASGDLFGAFHLLRENVGKFGAYLYAIALLASGQSASITATLSGQVVSEGFINWKLSPWLRRLITRGIGIGPALAVAIAVGKDGVNSLLIGSQVGLSVALPFVIAPLVLFTSLHSTMSTRDNKTVPPSPVPPFPSENISDGTKTPSRNRWSYLNPFRRRSDQSKKGKISFANPYIVVWVGTGLVVLVTIADVYALYQVGVGQ